MNLIGLRRCYVLLVLQGDTPPISFSTTALRFAALMGWSDEIAIWHLRLFGLVALNLETDYKAGRVGIEPAAHPFVALDFVIARIEGFRSFLVRPSVCHLVVVDEEKLVCWIGGGADIAFEDEQEVVLRHASLQGEGLIAVAVGIVPEKDFIFQERPPPVSPSSAALRLPADMGWLSCMVPPKCRKLALHVLAYQRRRRFSTPRPLLHRLANIFLLQKAVRRNSLYIL